MSKSEIERIIEDSIRIKQDLLVDAQLLAAIEEVAGKLRAILANGGRILLCGNGGSAADAQHIAAELSGRFYHDRAPFDAEALHVNTSYLTAVGNDYGFEYIYERLVRAKGRKGDALIAISTSGNSENILKALEAAAGLDMLRIGMTGLTGGKVAAICDHLLNVRSEDTPRIQECHILIGHILCELIEAGMAGKN